MVMYVRVKCDIFYFYEVRLSCLMLVSCAGHSLLAQFTLTVKLSKNQFRQTHIIIPLDGKHDMIRASFCPSETSVCHILVTHYVQSSQGFRTSTHLVQSDVKLILEKCKIILYKL